jgi:hypothetical protein
LEDATNSLGIGNQGVAGKSQAFDRSLGDFFVASAAGVNNDHRNKTEVRVVARSRFDLDLHCYADNDECVDPAIPQREI